MAKAVKINRSGAGAAGFLAGVVGSWATLNALQADSLVGVEQGADVRLIYADSGMVTPIGIGKFASWTVTSQGLDLVLRGEDMTVVEVEVVPTDGAP